jgi:hypothetical protein
MSDNAAVLEGYTLELMAYAPMFDLHLSVKPDTDLDDRFRAWDHDAQEWIMVNGWMATFEEVDV